MGKVWGIRSLQIFPTNTGKDSDWLDSLRSVRFHMAIVRVYELAIRELSDKLGRHHGGRLPSSICLLRVSRVSEIGHGSSGVTII